MQWNNLYLIPIVLVGGLLAFGVGRTIVARVLAVFGRLLGGAANKVAATVPAPADKPVERVYIEPAPARQSMAECEEIIAEELLRLDDARQREFEALVALDKKRQRMNSALAAARRQAGTNALSGAYVDNRSGLDPNG